MSLIKRRQDLWWYCPDQWLKTWVPDKIIDKVYILLPQPQCHHNRADDKRTIVFCHGYSYWFPPFPPDLSNIISFIKWDNAVLGYMSVSLDIASSCEICMQPNRQNQTGKTGWSCLLHSSQVRILTSKNIVFFVVVWLFCLFVCEFFVCFSLQSSYIIWM